MNPDKKSADDKARKRIAKATVMPQSQTNEKIISLLEQNNKLLVQLLDEAKKSNRPQYLGPF